MLGELQDLIAIAKKAEAALDAVNTMKEQMNRIERDQRELKTLLEGFIHGKQSK